MSRRSAALRQRIERRLAGWTDPHGGPPRIERIDLNDEGALHVTARPTRPHCPCCLYDLDAMQSALLGVRGVTSVRIDVIGVPEPERWNRALQHGG